MSKHAQDELKSILENFDLKDEKHTFRPLHIGYINDTYLVSNTKAPKFILQRVNHDVFRNIEGLMDNIENALSFLSANDYAALALISTHSKKSYFTNAEGYWRLMTYIENSTSYNTTNSNKVAFEAGRIIGKFHLLLADANVEDYVDTISKFHSIKWRGQQFQEALSRANTERVKLANEAILFSKEMMNRLQSFDITNLPKRVCHNDTKLNNILFSKKTDTALCLIDLDTLMKGYFLYDFGDAVRTIVNTALEDEREHYRITFKKELFESFVNGLAANKPFLRQQELDSLHVGAVLMPFLHGIRALTDYLNNDVYYKVTYKTQNLDRCLSLYDFTQKAYENLDYIKSEISRSLRARKK